MGDLLLRGIGHIIGTVHGIQPCCQFWQLFGAYPTVKGYDAAVGQQPVAVLLPHLAGGQPVSAQLQCLHPGGKGCQLLLNVRLFPGRLFLLPRQRVQQLLYRAGAAFQLSGGKTVATQQLQRLRRYRLVGNQQHTLLLPAYGKLIQHGLRDLRIQRPLYRVPVGKGGQRAGGDICPAGAGQLCGDVQRLPRQQRRAIGVQLCFLGSQPVQFRC